jgi:hypothetical protein
MAVLIQVNSLGGEGGYSKETVPHIPSPTQPAIDKSQSRASGFEYSATVDIAMEQGGGRER